MSRALVSLNGNVWWWCGCSFWKKLMIVKGSWINKLFPLKVTEVVKRKRKFIGSCISETQGQWLRSQLDLGSEIMSSGCCYSLLSLPCLSLHQSLCGRQNVLCQVWFCSKERETLPLDTIFQNFTEGLWLSLLGSCAHHWVNSVPSDM